MGDWSTGGDWAGNNDWLGVSVFDTAVFLWHPGDVSTPSSDLVTETDAAGVTEGSIVTHDTRTGRSYSGAVGSRFAAPITNLKATSWTMFVVTRSTEDGLSRALNFANSSDTDRWAGIWVARNDANRLFNFRLNGSSVIGATNWPAVTPASQDTGDFYVNVMRYTRTDDSNGTLDGYQDSSTAFGTDTLASGNAGDVDRLTVGRLEDSSPTDSGSGEIYAAAVWDRALLDSEIAALIADPFTYLDDTGGQSISVGVATESEEARPVATVFDQSIAVTAAVETESAETVVVDQEGNEQIVTVSVASETEAAGTVVSVAEQIVAVGLATEVESAVAVLPPGAEQAFVGWGIPI